jgi:hypothetical protein
VIYLESIQSIPTTPPTSKQEAKPFDIIIIGHGGVIDTTPAIVHAVAGEEAEQEADGGHSDPKEQGG